MTFHLLKTKPIKQWMESALVICACFRREEKGEGAAVEAAVFHLSRQNQTKRKRQGEKIWKVDVELTCL